MSFPYHENPGPIIVFTEDMTDEEIIERHFIIHGVTKTIKELT